MDGNKFLKNYYDMACHNLLCYSKNYGMTEPKEGMENEWQECQEEIEFLKSLSKMLEPKNNERNLSNELTVHVKADTSDVIEKLNRLEERLTEVNSIIGSIKEIEINFSVKSGT